MTQQKHTPSQLSLMKKAAPDLLEALIKSYKYISHMEKNLSKDGEYSELCLMIDAAISKATGE